MYLVTGATGNVGRELVGQLLAGGQAVRVFVRDAERASAWRGRVDVAVGDFARPETFARALQGVRAVFVVNGGPDAATFERLMAAAVDAGRPRVVFLSSILAANPASRIGAMHRQKEDLVRAAGLEGTFLRCGAFMTNAYQWAGSIRAEGVVYNAMGEGRYAPIAPEDIAAVAVVAMTAEVPLGEILELTGAEMLTVPEQVRTLSKLLGRPLGCVDVPIEAAIQNLVRNGVPPRLAEAVGESFDAVRRGRVVRLTDTVASVTGREPLRFEAWARQHAGRFGQEGQERVSTNAPHAPAADQRVYRVDKFKVPQAAREEFLGRVRSTHDFLRTLGGFVEDLVLQQTEGPGEFNVVTIVVWRDSAALASAKVAVTQRHRNIGFDPRETVARLGIDADIGIYERL